MTGPGGDLPARRISTKDLERVIRRAVELQSEGDAESAEAALTEEDAVRIGQELGIDAAHLRRALVEAGGIPDDTGWLARYFGTGLVSAVRYLERPAGDVSARLDSYMIERETLSVQRRMSDRMIYEPRAGVFADMTRVVKRGVGRFPLAKARTVEVAVRAAGEHHCHVRLTADLRHTRGGLFAAGTASGGVGGGAVGLAAAIALVPPAALLGLPVLLLTTEATRRAYRSAMKSANEKLAGILDRLEHDLPLAPEGGRWFDWLGG